MTDDSTSGPLNGTFLSAEEAQTSYEPLTSHGFSQLVKVKRQGRWFLLKGLKEEFRNKPVYLELLKKEYELMVQLDRREKTMPILAVSLLALSIGFLLNNRIAYQKELSATTDKPDPFFYQKNYIESVLWQTNTMIQPVIREAEQGGRIQGSANRKAFRHQCATKGIDS